MVFFKESSKPVVSQSHWKHGLDGLEKQRLISCIVLGMEQPVWTSATHPSLPMDARNCSALWNGSPLAVVTSPDILGRYQCLRCDVVFCVRSKGRGNPVPGSQLAPLGSQG